MMWGSWVWMATGHAGVVINELLPDPPGADGGQEWVELYNDGATPVDLAGWRLEKSLSDAGTFTLEFTFPPGASIGPGGYVLVGEELVVGATFLLDPGQTIALGNAGSTGDAVRLTDASQIVQDTVIYGQNNNDGFLDDLGAVAVGTAPKPVQGQSLARQPNGQDTQDSSVDFAVAPVATPGGDNAGGIVNCGPGPGVVINELIPNPSGADTDLEWVELFNPGSDPIDLSGWAIASGTSSYTAIGTIPGGTTIPPGGFLVVGQTAIPVANVVAPGFSLGNASNADAVQLRDPQGCPMDTVVYGTDNSDGWLDDTGALASLAPVPGEGQTLARTFDGVDTNAGSDFVVGGPTPGLSNLTTPPDCGGRGSGLVINELLTNPAGTDDGFEWVELYHAGSSPIDLEGWQIQTASSDSWTARFTFGLGDGIAPGQFLLVGGASVPGRTHELAGALGNGTGGDGVRIADCAGFPSDTVVYGSNNEDGVVDDSGGIAQSLAPVPPEGGSIQRREDGLDSDQSALDFAVSETITPGGPNPFIEPLICEPNAGGVRINEILPDPDGSDAGFEFVELYNAGDAPARVDGWALSMGTSNFLDLDVILPGNTVIEPGGFLVVGGEFVPEATIVAVFSMGNGSSSPDGVRLFDCQGTSIDTVIYGVVEAEPPAEPTGIVDDNDLPADPYGDPGSNQALFREVDGVDSDSAVDWKAGRPTPGSTNVVDYGPGGTQAPGCGCGGPPSADAPTGSAPGGDAPNGACSTVPQPIPVAALGLLIALVRRRR